MAVGSGRLGGRAGRGSGERGVRGGVSVTGAGVEGCRLSGSGGRSRSHDRMEQEMQFEVNVKNVRH